MRNLRSEALWKFLRRWKRRRVLDRLTRLSQKLPGGYR